MSDQNRKADRRLQAGNRGRATAIEPAPRAARSNGLMWFRRQPRPLHGHFIWPHVIAVLLFAIGAALALSFLHGSWGWSVTALGAAVCTGFWVGSGFSAVASRPWRWIGRACWLVVIGCHVLWLYVAIAFGILLAWTVPGRMVLLIAVVAVAAAGTAARPRGRVHIPLVLPLGLWIAAVLSGWLREENLLRCDDYLAPNPSVQLVVPSDPRLASCRPGEIRPSGRFPRTIWEAPDGQRVVFTTQGTPLPGGIDGSVCEARLATGAPPHCVGVPASKSQGIIDLPDQGRLLVFQWGIKTPSGSLGAVVLELRRNQELAILAEHWIDEMIGEGFYEPQNSTLYMFSDEMNGIHRAVLPTFERQPPIPIEWFTPGELHYDPGTGEGVACGNHIGAAIRGAPFVLRNFVDGRSSLIEKLSLTWGCDWDEAARTVYTTVPNLGLLDKIDYDTGRVEQRWFVGLGMRSVAYDRLRRRVYFTDFLRGNVFAFDEPSERIVARWFVGRFSRWVRLTRDGRALLVTSNLGIVRIPLDSRGP